MIVREIKVILNESEQKETTQTINYTLERGRLKFATKRGLNNENDEIQVGDSLYKYSESGLYFVHINGVMGTSKVFIDFYGGARRGSDWKDFRMIYKKGV